MTPRWARLREELDGDLQELFAIRAARDGVRAARRWYYWQLARAIVETHLARRRNRARSLTGDSVMQTIAQDIRYGIRMLRKQPGFTVTAVLMLALGIGANATVFSWINTVLLNPLPGTSRSEQLVQVSYLFRGSPLPSFSYPDYRDLRDSTRVFSGVAVRDDLAVGIVIDKEAERAWAEIVSGNYFDVLGVSAWRGRLLQPPDDVAGTEAVAVISHDYWTTRLAADDRVIGRRVMINAHPFTIAGVVQPGFNGGQSGLKFDLWVPVGTQPQIVPGGNRLEISGSRWLSILARLRPDASVEQARTEVAAFVANIARSRPGFVDTTGTVFTLWDSPTGGISVLRPVLLVLMTVAAIVLLIACANLAGLLLARSAARQREMAIRLSVGAGRSRLVQQLLVEASLLAALGMAGALVALQWTSGLLMGFAPPSELPIHLDVQVDARVAVFTAAIALSTLMLFALVPALQATFADLAGSLRDAGSTGRGSGRHRLRRSLVAAQIALSTILLVGAGLCLRSLSAARTMTPGFDATGVVVGWLDLIPANYTGEEDRSFYLRLLDRMSAMPGVESVSLARRIPLGFVGPSSSSVTVEGHAVQPGDPQIVSVNYIGPDYLRTMRIPLVSGRDLTRDDILGQRPVAIITEAMARTYWRDREAVAGRFAFGRGDRPAWITVIGVARDIKQRTMTERPQPTVWLPVLQSSQPSVVLHVRAAGAPGVVAADLSRAVRALDPNITFYDVGLLSDHVKAATFQQRMAANLLVVFGGLALLLAAIGSYGVLSYLVGQRRREIGIRLAIGATRSNVFRLIVSNGAWVVGSGAAAGLALSVGAGFGLRGLLIGVPPVDPVTHAAVALILMVVALIACAIPARRAAALDPALTLREE